MSDARRFDPLLPLRRSRRNESTDAERVLWRAIRGRQIGGHKFRRQHPSPPYILDFYCLELRLAIELDGGQHFTTESVEGDARRTAFLANRGIRCLRFTNLEILLELDSVIEAIRQVISPPSP